MNPRGIFGFLVTLLFVGLLIGIGAGIYQAGIAQGIVDAGRFPAGANVPVVGYGYGHGHGLGFLGLLFPILFLFLLFGLIRAAFSRGRGWGPGGWGRSYGHGPGFGPGGFGPDGGPEGWREERERRMAELHRRLHEESDGGTSGGTTPPSGSTSR